MHTAEQIRAWLAVRPVAGSTEGVDVAGSATTQTGGGVPLGGNDSSLRAIRDRIQKDVAKNGVQSRSSASPRSNRK